MGSAYRPAARPAAGGSLGAIAEDACTGVVVKASQTVFLPFPNIDEPIVCHSTRLYERANLAKDASLPLGHPSSTEFSLGIPATSREDVDSMLDQAARAGGTLTAPAHMRPFGVYSGYFTDPDGHLFEVACDTNA